MRVNSGFKGLNLYRYLRQTISFIYLFICDLFKDAVSPSDHLPPTNAQTANNWSITSTTRYGFMPGALEQPQTIFTLK